MSEDLQINVQDSSEKSSGNRTSVIKKFLDFKIRDQFLDLPDATYRKPLTVSILQVINKLFLFMGLFGCLWFSLFYSYQNLSLYFAAVAFLVFVLILLALGWLTITEKIEISSLIALFVLMLLSSSFWLVRIGL